MTHEEQTSMHIAQCQICTLGDAMKHCQTCPFRIGLVAKLDAMLLPAAMPKLTPHFTVTKTWVDRHLNSLDDLKYFAGGASVAGA